MKKLYKYLILFLIGGSLYYLIETLWRGYSHPTMFILGGICFLLIGEINQNLSRLGKPMVIQLLLASLIITILELGFGIIFNLKLGLNIWDYSSLRYNFLGQISLGFSLIWFLLSLPAIVLYDYLNHVIFKEERTGFKFI